MNLLRVRYFPLFLLLSLVVVLLVPYYFFESHPLTPINNSRPAAIDNITSWRSSADEMVVPPLEVVAAQIASQENEIPRDTIDDDNGDNGSNHRGGALLPLNKNGGARPLMRGGQIRNAFGGGGARGFQMLPRRGEQMQRAAGQYGEVDGFMQLHPRAAEFALQMARDRLRLEKFGVRRTAANRSPGLENNAIGGHNNHQDGASAVTGANDPDPELSTPKLQVLVMSYFRGGTTFFGDLLNQHPGTYYHFEPLHAVSVNDQVSGAQQTETALTMLRHLLRCDYRSMPDYVNYVRESGHRFLFEHNRRLWLGCQFHPPLCFEPNFLSSICDLHPVHVFKLVRLRLAAARVLLDEFPQLQLIYFVRDPRGLYSSRRDLDWCNVTRSCIEPEVYCADMQSDLAAALELRRLYPDRFLALRYEDLALDTESYMRQVLSFLHIESSPRMFRFIESHTRPRLGEDLGGPYSTRRDSKKTAFQWRRKLSPQEVSYVESSCSEVIKQLALP